MSVAIGDDVHALHEYHPYRVFGERNPKFDKISGRILDLKSSDLTSRSLLDAVDFFLGEIKDWKLSDQVAIAVVPSHDPTHLTSGIRLLAEKLAHGRIDATHCLVRHTWVPKKATGGSRDVSVDLNSIRVDNANLVRGRWVFLLDDVTTSGNSLKACRQLLMQAGATGVVCLAIGKTTY